MLKGILLVFFGACSFGILSTFVKLAYHDGYTLGDVTGAQAFFWRCNPVDFILLSKSNLKIQD